MSTQLPCAVHGLTWPVSPRTLSHMRTRTRTHARALNVAKLTGVTVALSAATVALTVAALTPDDTRTYTWQGTDHTLHACTVDRHGQTSDTTCYRVAGVTDNGPGHDYIMLDGARVYGAVQVSD